MATQRISLISPNQCKVRVTCRQCSTVAILGAATPPDICKTCGAHWGGEQNTALTRLYSLHRGLAAGAPADRFVVQIEIAD